MHLYVDADACPRVIKEIIYRAVTRLQIPLILVSNLNLKTPTVPNCTVIDVPEGEDVADDRIVELVEKDDLVITADIPLADRVIKKGAFALDPRGDFHTPDSIKQRLAIRNLMDNLRSNDIMTGGPAPFNLKDRQAFANQLDKFIAKLNSR
jgi:uncharacterized protein